MRESDVDSSISLVAILFQFAEAKMNAKAVVAASTTIAGAAAIVGAERRPRGYYHNFIISSFQGSLPPVSRQQHLNARRTRYRPRVSLVLLVRLLAGRLFLLAPTDSLVSCWEHVQVAPTTSELFKQLEGLIYTRAHTYLTKFGLLFRLFPSCCRPERYTLHKFF